jgi:hypothetical protein
VVTEARTFGGGTDFFNARYFGAALGRFTSPDPDSPRLVFVRML